jgi:hypothetical protein
MLVTPIRPVVIPAAAASPSMRIPGIRRMLDAAGSRDAACVAVPGQNLAVTYLLSSASGVLMIGQEVLGTMGYGRLSAALRITGYAGLLLVNFNHFVTPACPEPRPLLPWERAVVEVWTSAASVTGPLLTLWTSGLDGAGYVVRKVATSGGDLVERVFSSVGCLWVATVGVAAACAAYALVSAVRTPGARRRTRDDFEAVGAPEAPEAVRNVRSKPNTATDLEVAPEPQVALAGPEAAPEAAKLPAETQEGCDRAEEACLRLIDVALRYQRACELPLQLAVHLSATQAAAEALAASTVTSPAEGLTTLLEAHTAPRLRAEADRLGIARKDTGNGKATVVAAIAGHLASIVTTPTRPDCQEPEPPAAA